MTTILRPIHPQHIMNIVAGLKTNEVRTKVPNCKTPYKVLVYCTSIKNMPLQLYAELHHKSRGSLDFWSGKIMGEYICDKVDCHGWDYKNHGKYSCSDEELQTTCLTREELNEYGEYGKPLFFEHITDFNFDFFRKEDDELVPHDIYRDEVYNPFLRYRRKNNGTTIR